MATAEDEAALRAFMERQYARSPEEVAAEARWLMADPQRGPLEGPWGPSGGGGVAVTASGRTPDRAASEGPIPVPAPERMGGEPGWSPAPPGSGPTAEQKGTRVEMTELTPEVLEEAARLLREQRETDGRFQAGQVADRADAMLTPPGDGEVTEHVDPPQAQSAQSARLTLERLLFQAPELVREALPNSRARSMVIQQLDGARLWFREAMEELFGQPNQ